MSTSPLTVTVTLDATKLVAQLERAAKSARRLGWNIDLRYLFDEIGTGVGAEARMYVRGAMDPAYTDPKVRDAYAQVLAAYSSTLAAEFLRGWVTHHNTDTQAPVLAWHRLIGGTHLEVGVAA